MNPYITVAKDATSNQLDITVSSNSTGNNDAISLGTIPSGILSGDVAFNAISFQNKNTSSTPRLAFFNLGLFVQVGDNSSLTVSEKIDIWVDLVNANVIVSTSNVVQSAKLDIRAEKISDSSFRLIKLDPTKSFTSESIVVDTDTGTFTVEDNDFAFEYKDVTIYINPREIRTFAPSGFFTAEDNNGTPITQAIGETISAKRYIAGLGDTDFVKPYTK